MSTTTARTMTSGRGWAYTGAISGGLVSIAANVAHSFIPPHDAPTTWTPEAGAVVGAVVWPVFLFMAVEILARVTWPHGLVWHILRWAGLLPVAVVAALVSYRHLSGLLAHYGEEPIVYYLGPLAVDGLMVMATGALMATSRHQTMQPNHAAAPAVTDDGTRAPAARTVTVSTTASTPATVDTRPAAPVPAVEPVPDKAPTPAVMAARITPPIVSTPTRPAAKPRPGTPSTRPARSSTPAAPASTLAPSTTSTPATASDAAQLALPVVPPDVLAKARQFARDYRSEHGTPITAGALAARLRVNSDLASQALAVLDLDAGSPTRPITTVNGKPVKATR